MSVIIESMGILLLLLLSLLIKVVSFGPGLETEEVISLQSLFSQCKFKEVLHMCKYKLVNKISCALEIQTLFVIF